MADDPAPDADELDHPDFDDTLDAPRLVADEDLDTVVLSPDGDPARLAEYAALFGTDTPT